jgi:hypothetical protein
MFTYEQGACSAYVMHMKDDETHPSLPSLTCKSSQPGNVDQSSALLWTGISRGVKVLNLSS